MTKQADAEMSKVHQLAHEDSLMEKKAQMAQAASNQTKSQADQEMAHARSMVSRADAMDRKAKHEISVAEATETEAAHEKATSIAAREDADREMAHARSMVKSQASAKAQEEMKQAAAMKAQASKTQAAAQAKLAEAEKEEENAKKVESQAASQIPDMEMGIFGCFFVILLLLLALAAPFCKKKKANHDSDSMTEPLIVEPEVPKPKPFEGKWVNEAGEIVTIEGSQVVHDNGKQEQIADLDHQTLYTHRVSVKKGWFKDSPEVRGASGKIIDEKAIEWSDGRVWKKPEE